MSTKLRPRSRDAGFSLVELMVSMGITVMVMGGVFTVLTDAYRASESANSLIGLNNNLRIGVDLVVRDLIQVAQGLPTGRTIQVPNGSGALQIQRPHPQGSTCTSWPAGTVAIPAVTPGPGCGPLINGVQTDVVTTLAVDSVLDAVPVQSFNVASHTATISSPLQAANGVDISNGGADDVRQGDLLMFTKGSVSALAYVTGVDGGQTVSFATGDPMNLNQFTASFNGTVDDLATTAPVTPQSASVSRIRMISYYLDATLDPATPRLVRHIGWGDPAVAVNQRGQTVAFGIENLQFTYDIVDGVGNPSGIRMTAADLSTGGACAPNECSPNQVRKMNIFLLGRSIQEFSTTGRFFRSTLNTQVSLRSLALVDRYR